MAKALEVLDDRLGHQFGLLEKMKVLELAKPGATVLLNSPFPATEVWDELPREVQQQIVDKHLELWVVDAYAVAREVGMRDRINTVMQPCFFQLAGVLPAEEAIAHIKASVEDTYARRGREIVDRNFDLAERLLASQREFVKELLEASTVEPAAGGYSHPTNPYGVKKIAPASWEAGARTEPGEDTGARRCGSTDGCGSVRPTERCSSASPCGSV